MFHSTLRCWHLIQDLAHHLRMFIGEMNERMEDTSHWLLDAHHYTLHQVHLMYTTTHKVDIADIIGNCHLPLYINTTLYDMADTELK